MFIDEKSEICAIYIYKANDKQIKGRKSECNSITYPINVVYKNDKVLECTISSLFFAPERKIKFLMPSTPLFKPLNTCTIIIFII